MYFYEEEFERLRREYPPGTKIVVHFPEGNPSEVNATVVSIDDIGTLHCDFEDGRHFGVMPGIDSFRKITLPELNHDDGAR